MRCPKCGEAQTSRTKRRGFLQRFLLPWFGYFPWECASCRFQHLSHQRGLRHTRSASDQGEPIPAENAPDQAPRLAP